MTGTRSPSASSAPRPLDMKQVMVTTSWDDGHALDMRLADLLARYGVAATFYISPRNRELSARERLTDAQLRQLSARFELGAHTMTHPRLTALEDEAARREIVDSKQYIEKHAGVPVRSFCYPGGYFAPRHEQMLKDAGFTLARTVKQGALAAGDNYFELPTTVHAYPHRRHFWESWEERAMRLFERAIERGGMYHLWGHSWEIDKNGDWPRLERVLKHIANRADARYVTNAQLV